MNFLDKLYESNYFGIGLFAVISFLVVTFLIVLFFGKRDEKRRLESTKELEKNNADNTFKETTVSTPVEVPVVPVSEVPIITNETPVIPTPVVETIEPVINEVPVAPINYNDEPITPIAPISYDYEPKQFVEVPTEEVESIDIPVSPVINEEPTPIVVEPMRNIEPIRLDTTSYDAPVEPKVIEPIRITIPEEPVNVAPIIDEVKPVVTPVSPTPTIVEPVVADTYYKPIEKPVADEIEVPSVDFDALAKSISDELDELENSTNNHYEDVKVTPIDEVVSKPVTQFSSVYVNEPVKPVVKTGIDLPNKIDLPTIKTDEIEPENYNI
jgi:hypothetical protein